MLRLPMKRIDADDLRPYFVGEAARATRARDHLVVDLHSTLEEPADGEPAREVLEALTPVRAELMRGDLRGAYLGWLLADKRTSSMMMRWSHRFRKGSAP